MAIIQKAKNKVIDIASDVMSAPARISAAKADAKATRVVNDAKTVRDNKGKPDGGDHTDPLFRARMNNIGDKVEAEHKAKKLKVAKQVADNPSDYGSDYAKMRSGSVPPRNDMQANGTYPKPKTTMSYGEEYALRRSGKMK